MKFRSILFTVISLLALLIVSGCGSNDEKQVKEVVSKYLAAWQRGDAAEMYDLHKFGTTIKKDEMLESFVEFPVIPLAFTVKTVKIDGKDAIVTADVTLPNREKLATRIKSASDQISQLDVSKREKEQRLSQKILEILESLPQSEYEVQTGTFELVKEIQDWKITKVEGLLHFTEPVSELLK